MHAESVERLKVEPYVRGGGGAEREARLPWLTDPYQAAPGADNHELSRLALVFGREQFKPGGSPYVFVQYVHLGRGEFGLTGEGQFFRFLIADLEPKRLTAHGRNLQRICDLISLRKLAWIRQADRDFRTADGAGDHEPIITKIEVEDWVRPEA